MVFFYLLLIITIVFNYEIFKSLKFISNVIELKHIFAKSLVILFSDKSDAVKEDILKNSLPILIKNIFKILFSILLLSIQILIFYIYLQDFFTFLLTLQAICIAMFVTIAYNKIMNRNE